MSPGNALTALAGQHFGQHRSFARWSFCGFAKLIPNLACRLSNHVRQFSTLLLGNLLQVEFPHLNLGNLFQFHHFTLGNLRETIFFNMTVGSCKWIEFQKCQAG